MLLRTVGVVYKFETRDVYYNCSRDACCIIPKQTKPPIKNSQEGYRQLHMSMDKRTLPPPPLAFFFFSSFSISWKTRLSLLGLSTCTHVCAVWGQLGDSMPLADG